MLSRKKRLALQHLCHPGPADAQVAGNRRPVLELAGVEERLVISSEVEAHSLTVGGVDDFETTFNRDALNRLTRVTQQEQAGGNAVAEKRIDLSYDSGFIERGNLTSQEVPSSSRHCPLCSETMSEQKRLFQAALRE